MTRTISNADDIIDSRDVIARIAELEAEREDLATAAHALDDDGFNIGTPDDADALETWDIENGDELTALHALAAEGSDTISDWQDSATLIRDSYFQTYAEELADDICIAPPKNRDGSIAWPFTCIDWEQAARELQYDYSSVEFDGVTYWGVSA